MSRRVPAHRAVAGSLVTSGVIVGLAAVISLLIVTGWVATMIATLVVAACVTVRRAL